MHLTPSCWAVLLGLAMLLGVLLEWAAWAAMLSEDEANEIARAPKYGPPDEI